MNYKTEQIADLFFEVTKHLKRITEKSLKEYGIGIGQLQVLLVFYRNPSKVLNQQDLVRELNVDKGNISRNIAKLFDKGFVEHTENNSRNYILSQEGIKIKGMLMNFFIDTHKKMIEGITDDELLTTLSCLLRISSNLEDI
ncbi:MAG: MarR family transcriptional regulator [Acidaminobacteraceae bacterium]